MIITTRGHLVIEVNEINQVYMVVTLSQNSKRIRQPHIFVSFILRGDRELGSNPRVSEPHSVPLARKKSKQVMTGLTHQSSTQKSFLYATSQTCA